MFKKIMILMLLSTVSILPVAPLAEINSSTKINPPAKMPEQFKTAHKTPILLAANDMTQLQNVHSEGKVEPGKAIPSSKEAVRDLTDIAPEAWLVLAALLCFVMRSSRRVV